MKVKEESEKVGLKLNIQKINIIIILSSPITSWQIDGEIIETVADFISLVSKITAVGDRSLKIRRHLLFGRKAMINLDSILKSRDITLPTKVHIVKAMVFPVVIYGCESWTVKKAEHRRMTLLNCGVGEDSWESLGLQGDPTSQSWKKSVLNIHLKDWCWNWKTNTLTTWCKELTHWKSSWWWERLRAGWEQDDTSWDGWMVSPNGWTWFWASLEFGDGQGSLACCSPCGHKESDTLSNWTESF